MDSTSGASPAANVGARALRPSAMEVELGKLPRRTGDRQPVWQGGPGEASRPRYPGCRQCPAPSPALKPFLRP